jgi:hypothetical protein
LLEIRELREGPCTALFDKLQGAMRSYEVSARWEGVFAHVREVADSCFWKTFYKDGWFAWGTVLENGRFVDWIERD